MTSLIVFDLDKTLADCNVSYLFGSFLFKHRFFSRFTMYRLIAVYLLHRLFLVSTASLHDFSFRMLFYGKEAKRVHLLADEFMRECLPGILRKELLDRLRGYQARGDHVQIFSSSPDFLVERIATYLGVAQFLATSYESGKNGTFTKVGNVIDGVAKLQALKNQDLQNVTAYSDSFLDFPLLQAVGRPIAVNPDRKLRQIAKARHWEILDL